MFSLLLSLVSLALQNLTSLLPSLCQEAPISQIEFSRNSSTLHLSGSAPNDLSQPGLMDRYEGRMYALSQIVCLVGQISSLSIFNLLTESLKADTSVVKQNSIYIVLMPTGQPQGPHCAVNGANFSLLYGSSTFTAILMIVGCHHSRSGFTSELAFFQRHSRKTDDGYT